MTTTRQTVPLGALIDRTVERDDIVLALPDAKTNKPAKKVDRWFLYLNGASNVVLSETYEDLHKTTTSQSRKWAFLMLYDESIAQRLKEAFLHAADLCRTKKPF